MACGGSDGWVLLVYCPIGLGPSDPQVSTDLPNQEIVDLAVARYGRGLIVDGIDENAVLAPVAKEEASKRFEMTD